MNEQPDKIALLNSIRNEYGRFDALLAQLSEADMCQPGVEGDWSVKDILAHLADWQSYAAGLVWQAAQGRRPERRVMAADDHDAAARVDAINERIFAQSAERTLRDARIDFHASYRAVLKALEALSEADLAPGSRFRELIGEPALEPISANTYEHYQAHAAAIRDWLERRRTGSAQEA